jgi:hypothetical protein
MHEQPVSQLGETAYLLISRINQPDFVDGASLVSFVPDEELIWLLRYRPLPLRKIWREENRVFRKRSITVVSQPSRGWTESLQVGMDGSQQIVHSLVPLNSPLWRSTLPYGRAASRRGSRLSSRARASRGGPSRPDRGRSRRARLPTSRQAHYHQQGQQSGLPHVSHGPRRAEHAPLSGLIPRKGNTLRSTVALRVLGVLCGQSGSGPRDAEDQRVSKVEIEPFVAQGTVQRAPVA